MAGLKKLRQREEIDDRYKWNIAAMYGDEKEWEKDLFYYMVIRMTVWKMLIIKAV